MLLLQIEIDMSKRIIYTQNQRSIPHQRFHMALKLVTQSVMNEQETNERRS